MRSILDDGWSPSIFSIRGTITKEYQHARHLLNERGLRPKKRYGQNFLMDPSAAARIAALAVGNDGLPLIEVGAGTGALTRALVALGAQPKLLEIDGDLIEILRRERDFAQLDIVHVDALEFPYDSIAPGGAWVATGNLPYNIGTPLLMQWVEAACPPTRIVVMLQRDVVERLIAQPGTPAYGSLSVTTQLTMNVRLAFVLPPGVFYPKPKVDSAVVLLERRLQPLVPVAFLEATRQVARAAFAYRRKTLANSLLLARGYDRTMLQTHLTALGLSPLTRGEDLDLAMFGLLAQRLSAPC